jgi:hypothetical protein
MGRTYLECPDAEENENDEKSDACYYDADDRHDLARDEET